jgi:hypothetical protein
VNRFARIAGLLLAAAGAAPASVVYSQGVASQLPPFAGGQLNSFTWADSFTLSSSALVKAVTFYDLSCCNFPDWTGTLNYYFFNDSSGHPASSAFAQGSASPVAATTIYSDIASNRVIQYDFNLASGVSLNGGTQYWLGLIVTSGIGVEWNFGSLSGLSFSANGTDFSNWGGQGGTQAFELLDAQFAPEPFSAGPLLAGVAMLAAMRARGR